MFPSVLDFFLWLFQNNGQPRWHILGLIKQIRGLLELQNYLAPFQQHFWTVLNQFGLILSSCIYYYVGILDGLLVLSSFVVYSCQPSTNNSQSFQSLVGCLYSVNPARFT